MSPRIDLSGIEAARRMAALSPETQKRFEQSMLPGWSGTEEVTQAFHAIGVALGSRRNAVSAANKKRLFAFVEQLLKSASPEIANTVATCLLEEIWSAAHGGGFDISLIDDYLGKEARGYLVAWDDFNKTRTQGLSRKSR